MTTKVVPLIDGDIMVYSIGFASEHDPVNFALQSVKNHIRKIMSAILKEYADAEYDVQNPCVFLSGKNNMRDNIASWQPYKGNRENAPKPKWYGEIREYLIVNYGAQVSCDYEADDDIATTATTLKDIGKLPIIVSIDKDLNMVPGVHYNHRKDLFYHIEEDEALRVFGVQCLTGDATDNIPGLFRVTDVTASAKLKARVRAAPCPIAEAATIWLEAFQKKFPEVPKFVCVDHVGRIFSEVAHLLWMKRGSSDEWWMHYKTALPIVFYSVNDIVNGKTYVEWLHEAG